MTKGSVGGGPQCPKYQVLEHDSKQAPINNFKLEFDDVRPDSGPKALCKAAAFTKCKSCPSYHRRQAPTAIQPGSNKMLLGNALFS